MLIKSSAIDRLLRENPELGERRFGLPSIGLRLDKERFNPTVQDIADAINFYGFEVRDEDIATNPDIDLGGGNPMNYKPFPLSIEEMHKALDESFMYKYPYTEGDDNIRKVLLDYIEQEGFINTESYDYTDIDDKGLSIHNITFLPSTSIAFNMIIDIISKPGDVVLVPGPNYGLFTIRAERAGAEVELIDLAKEDNFLINPEKLAKKIDEINESLQRVYHRRRGYVPRVVAFLNMNPSNPTGKVMGERDTKRLTEISKVCLDRGVFIIDDLVYRDVTFDQNNIAKPISTIPGMFRNTISLFGLSKSYGMASLRAGFVVADEIIIRELINRIFQGMDSSPDIVGRALSGAFNTSEKRKKVYDEYFTGLRNHYIYRFNLLKSLVKGIDSIKDLSIKNQIIGEVKSVINDDVISDRILLGLPYTDFPMNLEPEAGFFAVLDFTKLKGMKYKGEAINTEKDLLKFFYKTSRVRFLIGQSISWPYKDELVARVTFALEPDRLIMTMKYMNDALCKLTKKDNFTIRKNLLDDQHQMAKIKVDIWKATYTGVVDQNYLDNLNYEDRTTKYVNDFREYKDLGLVAVKDDEVLGYSRFKIYPDDNKYDSELISLYARLDMEHDGIKTSLFHETVKELLSKERKTMIVWCLNKNLKQIDFYEKLGGTKIDTRETKVGDKYYEQYGIYFDLETVVKELF